MYNFGSQVYELIIIYCVWISAPLIIVISEYIKKNRFYSQLYDSLESIDQKYLLHEILPTVDFIEAGILQDVLKTTNKAMNDMLNELNYQQEDYKDFIEAWVHEVKTPLAVARLLINSDHVDPNELELELIRIETYIEQVLFYARINNANKDFRIKKTSVEKMVNNVLKSNSKILIRNQFSIQKNISDCIVNTDSKWVEFILNQIINNSIKYATQDNKVISFELIKSSLSTTLIIKDNGIGIDKEDLKYVFDKGFTGINGRQYSKSTGIGLYICKSLADKLNLGLKMYSTLGEGSETHLIFPIESFIEIV
jgi:signal transduction histidine kinase